ncbi:MAG TPA: histidine--tRNA ligase [Kofleriaceae bacterium]|nr:histidine--tRNA ligase [Kofleriaceae bacterium]
MSRAVSSISGFPEWLPEQQIAQDQFIAHVRRKFELHGFAPIETRAVEPLTTLQQKGADADKQIYVLQHSGADGDAEAQLGLHFDLTVPFARFVAERLEALTFPLKRYQIQRAWRGERPQEGRYREFVQADIDVVNRGTLPLIHDIELPGILIEILDELPIPPVTVLVNNRKLMQGFCEGLGITDLVGTLRIIDKLDKIGPDGVRAQLAASCSEEQVGKLLSLCRISSDDASFVDGVRALAVTSPLLDEGLAELVAVMEGNRHVRRGALRASLHIARGLDYYTGTVYEGTMAGFERLGAVCSGGRYDSLVGQAHGRGEAFPGVGVSIGITRILGVLMGRGLLVASRQTPACVMVALNDDAHRDDAMQIARTLRARGIPTEVFHEPIKFGKQIRYAQRKGIPYVWFQDPEVATRHQVRDMSQGAQVDADLATWAPEAQWERPTITRKEPG